MVVKLEVRVTNQSFNEAGGSKEFPNLELGDIVSVQCYSARGRTRAIEKTQNLLKEKAGEREYTHVFGVKFGLTLSCHPSYDPEEASYWCTATGTGYKSKT